MMPSMYGKAEHGAVDGWKTLYTASNTNSRAVFPRFKIIGNINGELQVISC